MAYSNLGTPVFYIDNYLYHKTIGTSITANEPSDAFTLSPTTYTDVYSSSNPINLPVNTDKYDFNGNMKYYFAFLNHALTPTVTMTPDTESSMSLTEVLNANLENTENGNSMSPLKGSTIFTTTTTGVSSLTLSADFGVGAISTGIQYTMPHSPDLKLNMEIEMDGVDTITTSGGGSISNIKYTGNPLWIFQNYKTNPFDVYSSSLDVTSTGARRNGRKSWSLKFSYISDTDLFSSNPRASSYTEHPNDSTYETSDLDNLTDGEPTSSSYLGFNIETDDSFYAQVWNKTLGGALHFIFQPDSNHNDDFYICKFDQDSLRISQSAYKVYDISLKIVEVW